MKKASMYRKGREACECLSLTWVNLLALERVHVSIWFSCVCVFVCVYVCKQVCSQPRVRVRVRGVSVCLRE